MSIHRAWRPLWLLAALLALNANAAAADLTAYVGGVKPGKLTLAGMASSLDSGPIYGFRLAFSPFPFIGHEHTLGFSSDFLFPSSIKTITDAKGFVYNSNLIVNLPLGKIVPYATAGIGLIHQYGSENLPVGTKFAFNYGGGLKLPRMVGPFGLRFDVRGYSASAIFTQRLKLLEVSGGILLSLGP